MTEGRGFSLARAATRGLATRAAVFIAALVCGLAGAVIPSASAAADTYRDQQWHLKFLEVAAAHRISTGSGVTVGVVDSGVKADHPDLVGSVLSGADTTGNGGNGHQDNDGHGTAMAALIAGHGHGSGNADGVLGISPGVKIYPVRDKVTAGGRSDDVAAGILAAVAGGAKVISISQVTGAVPSLQQAIQAAIAADAVVVAGSGNKPDQFFFGYPAAYPGVVAVGATGRDGNLDPVTVTGKEMMLVAPGEDIVSASNSGGYVIGTGTSNSTAIVAGAAALVRSKYPKLSAKEVVHRLTATATDKGAPGRDPEYGYGVLNLVAALQADVKPESPAASPSGDSNAALPEESENADQGSGSNIVVLTAVLCGLLLLIVVVVLLVVWLSRRGPKPPKGPQGGYGPSGPPQQGYPLGHTYGNTPHPGHPQAYGQPQGYGNPPVPLPPAPPGPAFPPPPGFGNPPAPQ
jgi:type VII secretion-associated serine protease mycosin